MTNNLLSLFRFGLLAIALQTQVLPAWSQTQTQPVASVEGDSPPLRQWPLRIFLFPGSTELKNPPKWYFQLSEKLLQKYQESQWLQPIMAPLESDNSTLLQTTPALHPETLKNLIQNITSDIFLHYHLIALESGYWLVVRMYSIPSGELVFLQKHTISQLSEPEFLQILESLPFDSIQTKLNHIIDLGSQEDPGEIHLSTTPTQQNVKINGKYLGKTPLVIRHIPKGQYKLEVYEEQKFQLERFQISTTPPNIPVYLNDKLQGKSPINLNQVASKPGKYQVSFEKNRPIEASLEINSNPVHLPVKLDNSQIQRTPITFQNLKNSEYSLEILPYNSIAITKNLTVNDETPQKIELNLYKLSRVSIDASESAVQVYLDDEHLGETPFTTTLTQGIHHLELKKPRFKSQTHILDLDPGKKEEVFFPLYPRSTDTSIFLTPTGEITSNFNIASKFLGFGSLSNSNNNQIEAVQLYGLEIDYGWPGLYRAYDLFDLGVSLSGYFSLLQMKNQFRHYQGLGVKMQFLKESTRIPISTALGSYINLDLNNPKLIGYISLSRSFFDFTLHLGLQTHGMNINIDYTGIDNLRVGLIAFADSFFGLLTLPNEELSTLYGLQLGYNF